MRRSTGDDQVSQDEQPIASGFLAIWSDIDPAAETDYLHWMTREHARERLGIPGFLAMRMFRALDSVQHRYFILYELLSPSVVDSAEYLARLNHPSAWSQRIMPQLRNFARGGGQVIAAFGSGRGGHVSALPICSEAVSSTAGIAAEIALHDRIASVRVLATDSSRTAVQTVEKGMRTGDRSFDCLLLVEGLDAVAVRAAIATAIQDRSHSSDPTIYQTVFSLDRGGM
jgi:hypothetical protein